MSDAIDNLTPELQAILKRADSIDEKKKKKLKKEKKYCNAAIVKNIKAAKLLIEKGNKIILNDKTIGKKNKTIAYSRCTKKQRENSKYCGIHEKKADSEKFKIFSVIESYHTSRVATINDIFFNKNAVENKILNSNQFISFEITENLRNKFETMFKMSQNIDDDTSDNEFFDTKSEHPDENSNSERDDIFYDSKSEILSDNDNSSKNNDDNLSDNDNSSYDNKLSDDDKLSNDDNLSDNDNSSDDDNEIHCTAISTKDGEKTFACDINDTLDVYDQEHGPVDKDGNPMPIGKLTEVNDLDAPIFYENQYYIVAKVLNYKNKNYQHCVISDRAYIRKCSILTYAGKVCKNKKTGNLYLRSNKKSK